jgi:hypothetical protein
MCSQANYSKYQRRVIKFLTDYLGSEIPFTYEKAQNNHLKVLIEGVPKPMYTGSTPSDSKSLNNFMAEVKREVKASQQEECDGTAVCKPMLPNPMQMSRDRLIQNTVKSLRTRLDALKSKEETLVLEHKSVDVIAAHRTETVKQAVSLSLQARKQGTYLKPKEVRVLEGKISNHLDFMLPSVAYYAELLDAKQKYKKGEVEVEQKAAQQQIQTSNVIKLDEKADTVESTTVKTANGPCFSVETKNNSESQQHANSATELMGMSTSNRVSLLRQLTKAQALMLIDDLNTAIAQNREEDIAKVVALIQEKDLPIEAIISRIDAA